MCIRDSPHTDYEKDVEFDNAPFGVIGLETALSAALDQLYHPKRLSLSETLSLLTNRPTEMLQLNKGNLSLGADGDVVILDPDLEWTPHSESFHSKSANSPWIGRTLKGKAVKTIVSGKLIYKNGQILP